MTTRKCLALSELGCILSAEARRAMLPARKETLSQISDLHSALGIEGISGLLSVEARKVRNWLSGKPNWAIYPPERKLIWVLHSMVFHPERLRSLFDVATFGRYLPDDMRGLPAARPRKRRPQAKRAKAG